MLNTDMCLFFDIEATFPCCTLTQNGGNNACDRNGLVLRNTQCATYPAGSPRAESASAVELFAGLRAGGGFDNDNTPFFNAFAIAWGKATTNGLSDLVGLDGIAINGVSISVSDLFQVLSVMLKYLSVFRMISQSDVIHDTCRSFYFNSQHPLPLPNLVLKHLDLLQLSLLIQQTLKHLSPLQL